MMSSFSSSFSFGRGNNQFRNPAIAFGSEVIIVEQSPFVGGGNSYSFIKSTDSYITTPGSSNWAVGTGDYTIEWFEYQTNSANTQYLFSVGDYSSPGSPSISAKTIETIGGSYSFRYDNNGVLLNNHTIPDPVTNYWYHLAIVRKNGITRIYRNGTLLGGSVEFVQNITDSTNPLVIGNIGLSTYSFNFAYVGYITNFRFIKGLGVYTGNSFTVPTSALTPTSIANPYGGSNTAAIGPGFTKLLLKP